MTEMPDVIRRAIEAQGKVSPDEVIARMDGDGQIIPPDETEAVLARRGLICFRCDADVDPNDPQALVEVIGFSRQRKDGGQNHVIARRPTGRLLCSVCGLKLTSNAIPADQMKLDT